MLHGNAIDKKCGFRTLNATELEAVSGGHDGGMLHKDANEIVVVAERIGMVNDDYYGYQVGSNILIFKDTASVFGEMLGYEDTFMGVYEPGTPDDHDLKLDDRDTSFSSNNGINIDVGPVGGGTDTGSSRSSSSDSTQYWKRVD